MNKETTIKVIETNLSPVIQRASEIEIIDSKSLLEATELLSHLNRGLDASEEDRLKITGPINASLKEINARYKPFKESVSGLVASIRAKMGKYQQEVMRVQREEEERIAGRIGPGKGNLSMDSALKKLDAVEKAEKNVDSGNGSVVFVEVEKFEVEDFKLLPDEYKVANDTAIRLALKEGVRVAGVRYFKEQQVRNKR